VVPFSGPQAQRAEGIVVRTLRKRATIVDPKKWAASQKKLFAPSNSPEDVASVAEDVGVVVVVTGTVKRDGRHWTLVVSVRDGKTGRSRDKLRYSLRGPRVEARTLALLGSEVSDAFDHALEAAGATGSDDEEAPPPKKQAPPPPPATKKKPHVEAIEDSEDDKPIKERDEAAPIEKDEKKAEVKKEAPAGARPRWAPYFDITAGASVSGRQWDFSPASAPLPKFSSGVVGGLRVDATIYPLASLWNRAAGVFATLGLGATLDKPFWPDSKGPDGLRYATQELRVDGGLRWRFVLYKALPRPELTLLAGGGLHSFAIAKKETPAGPTDVGPPDVRYANVSLGLAFRIHFVEWASLWVGFNYLIPTLAGAVVTADSYGPASRFGIRAQGGIDFFAYRGLKVGLNGFYERYQLVFKGGGALPGPGSTPPEGAVDQYFGGVLVLGYAY
jgi:hypothetical protein